MLDHERREEETLEPLKTVSATPMVAEALEELLRFGALMLRACDTAFRVRRAMTTVARGLGFDGLSVQFGLDGITASGRRGSEVTTLVREVGAPGINSSRITALDRLAHSMPQATTSGELAAELAAIESAKPLYSIAQTAVAVGGACGAFAFLNGGAAPEVAVAGVGGAVGQALRTLLLRRRLNQYAVAFVCAMVASGVYWLVAAVAARTGFSVLRDSVGLISCILFLVPGFPLVTALLDLLQHETGNALTRLAYALMLFLAGALGLIVVMGVVGFSVEPPPASVLSEPVLIALRAIASFVGGCGFAILYNSERRTVLHVGVIAVVGNEIRLALHDTGVTLPLAACFGALAVGLTASLLGRWLKEPRVALTVPGIILMVPGLFFYEMCVYFQQGEILAGLQAAVLVGFILAAMALGLAAALYVSEPAWLRE